MTMTTDDTKVWVDLTDEMRARLVRLEELEGRPVSKTVELERERRVLIGDGYENFGTGSFYEAEVVGPLRRELDGEWYIDGSQGEYVAIESLDDLEAVEAQVVTTVQELPTGRFAVFVANAELVGTFERDEAVDLAWKAGGVPFLVDADGRLGGVAL